MKSPASDFRLSVCSGLLVLVAGGMWYLGNGLTGDYWYLTWLAPIPSLVGSLYYSRRASFWLAFTAQLLGRSSWFSYLQTVVSLIPALLILLALSYVFARIIVRCRGLLLNQRARCAVLTYPVLITGFECLVMLLSPDGTATSLAYSQLNALPLIQVASLTGSLGITFLISLFPSICAVGWLLYQREKRWPFRLIAGTLVGFSAVFLYGFYRFSSPAVGPYVKVGLVVLDEEKHHTAQQESLPQSNAVNAEYAQAVAQVAAAGATVVVLPETAFRLTPQNRQAVIAGLSNTAQRTKTQLVVGIADYSRTNARNAALVINPAGAVVADYTKNHLVRGFERQFTPGNQTGVFPSPTGRAGVAICKDLDFPNHIRTYGRNRVGVLFVPANDFVVDDWLHARMAILRGVENGFSVVRTAQRGRLTISDAYGRVLSEADASRGRKALLVGTVPMGQRATLYAYAGNWFGVLNLLAAAYFLWFTGAKRKSVSPLPV